MWLKFSECGVVNISKRFSELFMPSARDQTRCLVPDRVWRMSEGGQGQIKAKGVRFNGKGLDAEES